MITLVTFILFVFVSSVIINGWHEITRTGRVFGFWESFWEHATQKDETEKPIYRFPEWVRNPISQCIMCMASVYGTAIFLIVTFVFKNHQLRYECSLVEVILIWFSYLLCLVVSNYWVHLKIKD